MKTHSKKILVLFCHDGRGKMRLAIQRHLHALDWSERRHQILYFNAIHGAPAWLRSLDVDVIVLHTTLLCMRWSKDFYLWKWHLRWIGQMPALKIAFPQDEYDHAEVLDQWLYEWGVRVVFTNFDDSSRACLYPIMSQKAKFQHCFTGYIDENDVLQCGERTVPIEGRAFDIVYRGNLLPFWFGSQGQLKAEVGERVLSRALGRGLKCDISSHSDDAVLGPTWLSFLGSGRAVLGCESGSTVLDRRGAVQARIQLLCRHEPDLTFEQVDQVMPPGWNSYEFQAISPRHFEAVLTRSCQVLVEGRYDGVFQPDLHYLALRRDFSNLDDILDKLKDADLLQRIADRAHDDIVGSGQYSYRKFASTVDLVLGEELCTRDAPMRLGADLGAYVAWQASPCAGWAYQALPPVWRRFWNGLRRLSRVVTFLKRPLFTMRKACFAARLVFGDPVHRTVLRHYLSNRVMRRKVHAGRLLSDLFMAKVLRMVAAGDINSERPIHLVPHYRAREQAWVLRSEFLDGHKRRAGEQLRGLDPSSPHQPGSIKKVLWDHIPVSERIYYPLSGTQRVNLFLGSNGVYDFRALLRCAEHLPKGVWSDLFVHHMNGVT